jgi:hypothetical protein
VKVAVIVSVTVSVTANGCRNGCSNDCVDCCGNSCGNGCGNGRDTDKEQETVGICNRSITVIAQSCTLAVPTVQIIMSISIVSL